MYQNKDDPLPGLKYEIDKYLNLEHLTLIFCSTL